MIPQALKLRFSMTGRKWTLIRFIGMHAKLVSKSYSNVSRPHSKAELCVGAPTSTRCGRRFCDHRVGQLTLSIALRKLSSFRRYFCCFRYKAHFSNIAPASRTIILSSYPCSTRRPFRCLHLHPIEGVLHTSHVQWLTLDRTTGFNAHRTEHVEGRVGAKDDYHQQRDTIFA